MDDIDLLVKLRIAYLSSENKIQSQSDAENIEKKLRGYFEEWLPGGDFFAIVAEENDEVCASAFLSVAERPPFSGSASNLVGTVYNVFTYPQHRRKGIASKVMLALLDEARTMGVATVDLSATADGKPLYDRLGFKVSRYTSMSIKFG